MQEKGNGALHIATQANQSSQVELLLVYGADPGSFDAHGRTAADIARCCYTAYTHCTALNNGMILPSPFFFLPVGA